LVEQQLAKTVCCYSPKSKEEMAIAASISSLGSLRKFNWLEVRIVAMPRLWFDKGTLLLKGEIGSPYGKWDPRNGCYRLKACPYKDVVDYFKESRIRYEVDVPNPPPLEQLKSNVELRTYQNKALDNWLLAENRGVLVLPIAAGKTFIA
jgi:hypothetical protein